MRGVAHSPPTTQVPLPCLAPPPSSHCAPHRIKMCMKYSSEFINHKSLRQTVWSIVELDVSLSPTRSAAGFGNAHGPGLGLGLRLGAWVPGHGHGHYKCSCLRDNIDKLCKHSHTINKARPTRPARPPSHHQRQRQPVTAHVRQRVFPKTKLLRQERDTTDTRQHNSNSNSESKHRIQEVKCRRALLGVSSRAGTVG